MAAFGPNTINAFANMARGSDLSQQMLARQLENNARRAEADQAEKARRARVMLGQALQAAGVPQIPTAATRPAASARMPVGGAAAPQQAPQQAPQGAAMPGAMPQGGAPMPGAQMPQGAPTAAAAMPNVQPDVAQAAALPGSQQEDRQAAQPFTWAQVLDQVRSTTGADPETVYMAVQEIMGNIDKESDRNARSATAQAQIDQKNQALMQTLQWRYTNTASQTERAKIAGEIKILQTKMQGDTQRDVAGINASSRENVAGINANSAANVAAINTASREKVAALTAGSREKIAADALALKAELGRDALDLKADQIGKTFLVKNREIELKQQGLDQKQAQFVAKLEATRALNEMRDETIRRGQDMTAAARQQAEIGRNTRAAAGIDAKQTATKTKAATGVDGAASELRMMRLQAEKLLEMPGLDDATGPIESRLPTLAEDTANFEAALETLKAQTGFSALQTMRSLSPTGGALGNVSNFEVKQLQNKIASLQLSQGGDSLRDNLLSLIDYTSRAEANLYSAYEKQFTPKATGAGGGVKPPAEGAPEIDLPQQLATEPEGTVFKMDGKTYTKRGNKAVLTE